MKNFSYFHPTLGQCWLLLLLSVIGQGIAGVILSPIQAAWPETTDIVLFFSYTLSFIPPLLFAWLMGRNQRRRNDVTGDVPPSPLTESDFGNVHPLLFFVLIGLSCYFFQMISDPLLVLMPAPQWFNDLMSKVTGGSFFWSFLTVAVCAPLLEEFLCRGLMCRGMLRHFKNPWPAILWSALIFAVMHLNPWQGIPAFLLGVYFGWVYYRTRSLWATIFLHFINNGTAVILQQFCGEMNDFESIYAMIPDHILYVAFWLASVALFAVINITFLNRNLSYNHGRE